MTNGPSLLHLDRSAFLAGSAALAIAAAAKERRILSQQLFWPDGARLAISFSLMFEGGGQPEDIASAILFVATNPYATGSTVTVDGGGTIAA